MIKYWLLSLQDQEQSEDVHSQEQDEEVHSYNFYSTVILEVLAKASNQEKEINNI